MYRDVDALLVRAAVHPLDMQVPDWPTLDEDTPDEMWRAWLRQVWSLPAVAEAITVASPALAEQVSRAGSGAGLDRRQVRRIVLAVARYLLRITGRSTPFGLFAGVAAARTGAEPTVRWGHQHRTLVRPGTAWLDTVITGLERCPRLLRRLPMIVNNTARRRGDQLVVGFQRPVTEQPRKARVLDDVSVRLSAPVRAAIGYASAPITVTDLIAKLADDFPNTPEPVIEAMVSHLVRLRILLTALRPPMTVTNGLDRLLGNLAGARDIPEVARLLPTLTAVQQRCRDLSQLGPAAMTTPGRAQLDELMLSVNPGAAPAHTLDMRLDLDVTVPMSVVARARRAAAALTRLTPYPTGMPAWQEYHGAFMERYGPGAVVPLLDLTSPETGLGLPATYRGSHRRVTEPQPGDRARRLFRLIQQSLAAGHDEIALDDQLVNDLAGDAPQAPAHVELFVRVHADSVDAIQQGRYELVVTGAARAAGATTGRFLPLLDDADQARIGRAYAAVPTTRTRAVAAQVSCPPVLASAEHLARTAKLLPTVSINDFPDGDSITVEDLAVGADADGMYLVWLSRRQLIEPTVFNAVEFRNHSHPLTRFLCELPRARTAVYMPFAWGIADSLPYLPRVRYERTVLAAARWNLTADDLPGRDAPGPQWQAALNLWRQQFRMPDRVYLVQADNLLPLDLTEALPLILLRAHLDKHRHARIEEAPPTDANGWLNGHAHEVVIPLVTTREPAPAPALTSARPVDRADAQLPGDAACLSAKLYAPTDRHTDLLTHIGELLAATDAIVDWWFVPYRDPEPHLRLRLLLPDNGAYGAVAQHLSRWALTLRQQYLLSHLQLDTYQPETGRYGHGPAMTAAEHLFSADSHAALAQRHTAARGTVDADALTAASMVDLAVAFASDVTVGLRWLIEHLPHEPVPTNPAVRAAALSLANPYPQVDLHATITDTAGPTWRLRRNAVTTYRQAVASQRDPLTVLPSLLHLHHVRMFGIDPARERLCRHLTRAAAQRWATIGSHP